MSGLTQKARDADAKKAKRLKNRVQPNNAARLKELGHFTQLSSDCIREARSFSKVAIVGAPQFTERETSRFANALASNVGLSELIVNNCQCNSVCIEKLVHALEGCPNLRILDLGCNTITRGEYEGVDAGGQALYDIDYDGLEALEKWVRKNLYLRQLLLPKNNLNATQLEGTFQTLMVHPGIRVLDISCNKLGIKGSIMLAKFIQLNRAIRSLDVRSCQLKDLGIQGLRD